MALPLIIAGIGAALFSVAGGVVYLTWKGTSIAILGPRGSGKTILCEFLRTGEISEHPSQTIRSTSHKITEKLKIKELELSISEIEDLPGGKDQYSDWKSSIERNEKIFYLLKTNLIIERNQEYIKRVLRDTKHIGEWIDKTQKKLYLIGTHCDKIPEFDNNSQNLEATFSDKINQDTIIKKIISHLGGKKNLKISFGTLTSKESCEDLVHTIFSDEQS